MTPTPTSAAPALLLRFKKLPDGATALSCTRADGSTTWQRTPAHNAAFFARHDLTHYAVETVLGHAKGFYGLLAAGWDFTDFAAPWPKGKIPADADPAEMIVGFFDADRHGDADATAEQFNHYAAAFYAQTVPSGPDTLPAAAAASREAAARAPTLTQAQVDAIRAATARLFARWDALAPGQTLELPFPAADLNE